MEQQCCNTLTIAQNYTQCLFPLVYTVPTTLAPSSAPKPSLKHVQKLPTERLPRTNSAKSKTNISTTSQSSR